MTADVTVIGGGLSGLASAVRLAGTGRTVTLIERAPRLGGRCSSFIDSETGDEVDNGQHVLAGAYRSTLEYLRLIGTAGFLKNQDGLAFHHLRKGFASLRISSLASLFQAVSGAMRFRLLSLVDRKNLLAVGLELHSWNEALESHLIPMTVTQWLVSLGQSEEAMRNLWDPIAVSVMNEMPEKASALVFARALRDVFLGARSAAAILLPTVGQTDLYVTGALTYLASRGCTVVTGEDAVSIVDDPKGITVGCRSGSSFTASALVMAVPHHAIGNILPPGPASSALVAQVAKIRSSPIISIHAWYDRDFMTLDSVGLIGRRTQWVFNRRRFVHLKGSPKGYLCGVISAAHDSVEESREFLTETMDSEVRSVFPNGKNATLMKSIVIKEKRASFSPTPEAENLRPRPGHFSGRMYIAGDWTNTGMPGTIEGAIASGFRAADEIASRQSIPMTPAAVSDSVA